MVKKLSAKEKADRYIAALSTTKGQQRTPDPLTEAIAAVSAACTQLDAAVVAMDAARVALERARGAR
jgi:hypothetical protein